CTRAPTVSALVPYTTLFRSDAVLAGGCETGALRREAGFGDGGFALIGGREFEPAPGIGGNCSSAADNFCAFDRPRGGVQDHTTRSEEQTSELQSRGQLVWRL